MLPVSDYEARGRDHAETGISGQTRPGSHDVCITNLGSLVSPSLTTLLGISGLLLQRIDFRHRSKPLRVCLTSRFQPFTYLT